MEQVAETVRKTKEGYGKPRAGYDEFLKSCKLLDPFMPETSCPALCKGYVVPSGLRLHEILIQPYYDSRAMLARPSDVLVASFPKTGTTWTQEISYLITHNVDLSKANSTPTEERVPYIELPAVGMHGMEQLPNPRLLKTHSPYQEIPSSFLENKTKIVYIARNPKDTIVSNYHFVKMLGYYSYTGSCESYLDEFLAGRVVYSSFADHVLSYWNERNNGRICFLTYEELQRDFHSGIRKIATFLGKSLTDCQVGQIAEHCSFDSMSKNPMTNYAASDTVILSPNGKVGFMRKGKVGDWKNVFTTEMNRKVDEYVDKHFQASGLEFEYEI